MRLEEALNLPFDEYMAWCHDFCREKAKNDPIFQDVYSCSAFSIMEALWAKRYWFNKCTSEPDPCPTRKP